jgi:phospholipase/carboxylesterase
MSAGSTTGLSFEHVLVRGSGAGTLLLLHATGGDEHQLVDIGRELAGEATLLSPRGQVLEDGLTRRFFRRHGTFELDIPDLLARTDELADFIAAASAAYDLDPDRVLALGYSNGANIAVSVLLRRPEALAGAVLLRPTLPYTPDAPPRLDRKPVLILGADRDPFVPRDRYDQLITTFKAGGAELTATLMPDGHQLGHADLELAAGWLAERVPALGWR